MTKAWEGVFRMPQPGRSMKPRTNGFTMVLDKGLGHHATEDLMATAADYIGFVKFSFGTSAFYEERVLREKVEIVTGAGVDIYPGGTFLEVTVWQNRYAEYLARLPRFLRDGILARLLDHLPHGSWCRSLGHRLRWLHRISQYEGSTRYAKSLGYFYFSDDLAEGHHILVRRKKVGGNPKPFQGRVFRLERAKEGISSGVPQISFRGGVDEVRWSYDIILKKGRKTLKRMDPVIIIGGGGGGPGQVGGG